MYDNVYSSYIIHIALLGTVPSVQLPGQVTVSIPTGTLVLYAGKGLIGQRRRHLLHVLDSPHKETKPGAPSYLLHSAKTPATTRARSILLSVITDIRDTGTRYRS
jgi:hypothetical protein